MSKIKRDPVQKCIYSDIYLLLHFLNQIDDIPKIG